MRDRIRDFFKDTYVFEWYYVLVIIAYMATLISDKARPGVVATALMGLMLIQLIAKKNMNIHCVMDVLIVVYFVYKAASVIWMLMANVMPISVYTGEFVVSLLPMIFYFAGRIAGGKQDSFYKKFMLSLVGLSILSYVLFAFAPQFYCDYLFRWSYISKANASTAHVRMQSVVGSTVFGAIMVIGMMAGLHFLCCNNDAKDCKKQRIFGVITVFISMVSAILSNQRSCMVAVVIVLIYINYLIFARFNNIPKKYAIIEVAVAVAIVAAICIFEFNFILKVWARIASLPTALSERSEQWVAAVNNMYSSWFGNGLGANGHRASGVEGAHVIADGGLIKMYCEEGVLGFSLFVYILFMTLKRGVRNISLYYAEIGIVAMALITSIGSNVLAFQLVTPIFWYAIGRVWEEYDSYDKVSFGRLRRHD